ncbi:hypothetical protein [Pasteuria penetrans]|uniref:hypothetical protein n=1 Tax=Pasteuria penetrans TaxID=86005 RepID=UPI000FAC41A9|nr:hypothetical protein [Pasteuria penetrans]
MLGRILLRMTLPAFVLVLSLTFPIDIQVAAEPDHKRSSEIVMPPPTDEAGSEMNWLDRLPISKVCKKELLLGTIFGALGGLYFSVVGRVVGGSSWVLLWEPSPVQL